jgi:hypothetical protein
MVGCNGLFSSKVTAIQKEVLGPHKTLQEALPSAFHTPGTQGTTHRRLFSSPGYQQLRCWLRMSQPTDVSSPRAPLRAPVGHRPSV